MGTSYSSNELFQWVEPVVYLVGGIVVGLIAEMIVLHQLAVIAKRSKWKGDDLIINSFRRIPFLIFTFTGLYMAISTLPINITIQQFDFLQKAYVVVVLILATIIISRIVTNVVAGYSMSIKGEKTSLFENLAKLLVYILGGLLIIQYLGISVTPILTALGIGGLAVALALQDTLSNLFSGIQVLASNQISPGEFIKLETGEEGMVTDISWRNTMIRTIQNNLVIIPNSKLATNIITNYSRPENELTTFVNVGVEYGSNLAKVEKISIETAKQLIGESEGVIKDFEPIVRFTGFGDSSIDLIVIIRVTEFSEQYKIRHELIKRLKKRFDEEGIGIPFPIRTVYLKKES